METLLNLLKFMAVLIGVIIIIFLVLLSLPKSKLRQSIMKIYAVISFVIAISSAIYVVSPIDIIPDFIPVAGQSDDIVAVVSALATAVSGYVALQKSKEKTVKKV